MIPRKAIYDCRGVPNIESKYAELYVVSPFLKERPVVGNPYGRVFPSVSATILFAPDGVPADQPYNKFMYGLAVKYKALIDQVLGVEPNGYFTKGIDLTKRGISQAILSYWTEHFGRYDGIHFDIFTPLTDDPRWDQVLAGMASGLRSSGKLVIGQQFHLTTAVMGTNGEWLEQSPTNFGYTMERHAAELAQFRDLTYKVDKREVIWVCELRWPDTLPFWYKDKVTAWCIDNDIFLSLGYDASAQ